MSNSNDVTNLGSAFSPSDLDVIVGRGKVCYKHSGNLRLARIVQSVLATYSSPEATKKSKTELIKSIVQQVREASPSGGFVKFDSKKGEWFEVGDRTAREKVSQAFRDALTDQYKSSSTSKTLKRRQERITRQISYRADETESQGSAGSGNNNSSSNNDPLDTLPFGNMSLASPSPRSNGLGLASPSPRNSGLGLASAPSPRASFTMGTRSPGGSFASLHLAFSKTHRTATPQHGVPGILHSVPGPPTVGKVLGFAFALGHVSGSTECRLGNG